MKKNDVAVLCSLVLGGFIPIFLFKKIEFIYILLAYFLTTIIIYFMHKYKVIDQYRQDEMSIDNSKTIFSIIFIITLSILTIVSIYMFASGVETIELRKILYLICLIWLLIVLVHIFNYIRIWR